MTTEEQRRSKCFIYIPSYAFEQNEKRKHEVVNPELNRWVLLRNVSVSDSIEEIAEKLKNYDYGVAAVEMFKQIPIVKITLSSAQDVKRILDYKNLYIGYNLVQCEMLDKYRSRPRNHFRQCRKCFQLNHIAKEFIKKRQLCK